MTKKEDLYSYISVDQLIKIADRGVREAQYRVALFLEKEASKQNKSSPVTFFAGLNG